MVEYIRVRAACLLQSISENREAAVIQRAGRQVPFLVGGLGETDHHGVIPGQDGQRQRR
jgi:hypothetical protein